MGNVLKPEPVKERKAGGTTIISLRLKNELIEEIDVAAQESAMSRTKAVVKLLRFALDANKQKSTKR